MLANVGYRLTSFADYYSLSYSRDNLQKILQSFGETKLMPSVFQELPPAVPGYQGMHFETDDKFSMDIFRNRIDILATADKKEGFVGNERQEILSKLLKFLTNIYSAFGDMIQDANRMALGVNFVYFDILHEAKTEFKKRFLRPVEFYNNIETDEFSATYAGKKPVEIHGRDETLNVITNISQYKNNDIDGYIVSFDINTIYENSKNRFGTASFEDFIKTASEVQSQAGAEFLNGCF